MIILEGPDNSGKSTLGAGLKSLLGWKFEHGKRFHVYDISDHGRGEAVYREALVQLTPRPIILDRCYAIGENIYGPIVRGHNNLNHRALDILRTLANSQSLIIYCRPPIENIVGTTKEEMPGVKENLEAITKTYDRVMDVLEKSGAFVIRYDYTKHGSFGDVVDQCKSHVKYFNSNQEKINELSSYL